MTFGGDDFIVRIYKIFDGPCFGGGFYNDEVFHGFALYLYLIGCFFGVAHSIINNFSHFNRRVKLKVGTLVA